MSDQTSLARDRKKRGVQGCRDVRRGEGDPESDDERGQMVILDGGVRGVEGICELDGCVGDGESVVFDT